MRQNGSRIFRRSFWAVHIEKHHLEFAARHGNPLWLRFLVARQLQDGYRYDGGDDDDLLPASPAFPPGRAVAPENRSPHAIVPLEDSLYGLLWWVRPVGCLRGLALCSNVQPLPKNLVNLEP